MAVDGDVFSSPTKNGPSFRRVVSVFEATLEKG